MCTVSIIAMDGGYRLVTNRDVGRDRVLAEYPHAWGVNDTAIGPIDPEGGGTWVAARPGLTLCILNYNLENPPEAPPEPTSRGRIIPALIDLPDATTAIEGLRTLDLDRFVPFRLLAVDRLSGGVTIVEGRWNGQAFERFDHPLGPPAIFVSSGLGDSVVSDRVPLFEQIVVAGGSTSLAQDVYHRHTWPDRGAVSVLMIRAAARTVSITEVEDTEGGLDMRYHPIDEEGALERGFFAAVSAAK